MTDDKAAPPSPPPITAKDGSAITFDLTGKPNVIPAPTKQKKQQARKPKRNKPGTSKAAAEARKAAFLEEYLTNGRNGTQACITLGYSEKSAHVQASRWIKDYKATGVLEERERELGRITGLDTERTLLEVARLAYGDPRKLFMPTGGMRSITELDDDTAAMVASVEHDDIREGPADAKVTVGTTTKVRLWDKNAALEKAMKFHGAYGRDNAQRSENLNLQVVMVAAPGRPS